MNIFKGYVKVLLCSVLSKKKPVLILTMGKVASTSVYESLKVKVKKCGVYHIHFLSKKMIGESNIYFQRKKIPTPYHIAISSALNMVNAKEKYKIITLVREPISRIISDFFQNYEKYEPELFSEKRIDFKKNILERIMNLMYEYNSNDNYETRWFNEEIVNNLGLRIYAEDYNYLEGYTIYKGMNKKNKLIVIRLENLNEIFSKAMYEFLNINNVNMIINNEGGVKKYGDVYDYVKNNLIISKDVCEKIYSSKYMRYFYTNEEINGFINKWSASIR